MKQKTQTNSEDLVFTKNNPDNMRKVMSCYKNVLVCGNRGVGKITHTVKALQDKDNVYYIGNPVDHEGRTRPGSYGKYLKYILSLKKDLKVVEDVSVLFNIDEDIIVIIDEIYGRSPDQLEQLSRLYDMKNIRIAQIVGCIKYMGALFEKVDIIVELHIDGAFTIDKEFGKSIYTILAKTI